jgi:hypothetical protein
MFVKKKCVISPRPVRRMDFARRNARTALLAGLAANDVT